MWHLPENERVNTLDIYEIFTIFLTVLLTIFCYPFLQRRIYLWNMYWKLTLSGNSTDILPP